MKKILSPRITESHIPERAENTFISITEKHRNTDIKYKNIIRPVRLLYPPEEVETIGLVSKLSSSHCLFFVGAKFFIK